MLLRIIPSVQILNQDTAADMTAKTVQQKHLRFSPLTPTQDGRSLRNTLYLLIME